MKLRKAYFVLGIITLYEYAYGKTTLPNESIQRYFEDYMNCAKLNNSSECLEITGRKKKGENNGNNVVIIGGTGGGHESYDDGSYYVEVEEDHGGKKGKRKGKKEKRKKKKKGGSKMYKKVKPMLYILGALKLLLHHFLLKKLAFLSFFTFLLSKISFILASLVALKQFFHTPSGHQRAESHKLEVIHIPIKKYNSKHKDADYEESKFVPVTYQPDYAQTTPLFMIPGQETFITSEEEDDGFNQFQQDSPNKFINSNDDELNEHNNYDRSDQYYDEKNFYINHVHSPFV